MKIKLKYMLRINLHGFIINEQKKNNFEIS